MDKSTGATTGAESFIESLNGHGAEHIFLNPGIDIVPIQGTIAQYRALGKPAPKVILCPHESVAVAAAHGYAMVSGKPQVVAVFQDVGTLQAGGAIVNLQYGRIPVILCAGRNPAPNRFNWQQEPFDQRKITRDYVKWDHEVHRDEDVGSVMEEAFRVASAEPCGPVYLSIPREVLTGKVGREGVAAPVKSGKTPEIDMDLLRNVGEMLIRSENPLVMTAYSGRHPESVASLVDLAETLGARVITTDLRMNFPSTHPLCPGIDATKGDSYDHYIGHADVLLLIDYDFPGPRPKATFPRQDARIIHVDMEPLKRGKSLWNRPADVLIEGDSSKVIPALREIVRQRLIAEPDPRFHERFQRLGHEHKRLKDEWRAKALSEASLGSISAEWLFYCINEIMDDDTILVHMSPSTADALAHQIRRTKSGTLFSWGDSAGSMGWPLGAAVGAKLASPDRMVVSLVGDGGFIYGCPVATLWAASVYQAPFLSIICNNRSYVAIRELVRKEYGEGSVAGEMGFEVGTDFKNSPDYAFIAKACHAHGQRVEDPSELLSVLKNAVDQVRRGKAAVIDVRL